MSYKLRLIAIKYFNRLTALIFFIALSWFILVHPGKASDSKAHAEGLIYLCFCSSKVIKMHSIVTEKTLGS